MQLKTFDYWREALQINQTLKQRILTSKEVNWLQSFCDEFGSYAKITAFTDKAITDALQGKHQAGEQVNMVMMCTKSISGVSSLDKPRCKLYIARCESYLLEKGTEEVGKAFEQLLKLYPSFIDAYIEYWKYLKFRMTQK